MYSVLSLLLGVFGTVLYYATYVFFSLISLVCQIVYHLAYYPLYPVVVLGWYLVSSITLLIVLPVFTFVFFIVVLGYIHDRRRPLPVRLVRTNQNNRYHFELELTTPIPPEFFVILKRDPVGLFVMAPFLYIYNCSQADFGVFSSTFPQHENMVKAVSIAFAIAMPLALESMFILPAFCGAAFYHLAHKQMALLNMPSPDTFCCSVCLSRPNNIAIIPCGHKLLCAPCAAEINKSVSPRCPACRGQITSTQIIYN